MTLLDDPTTNLPRSEEGNPEPPFSAAKRAVKSRRVEASDRPEDLSTEPVYVQLLLQVRAELEKHAAGFQNRLRGSGSESVRNVEVGSDGAGSHPKGQGRNLDSRSAAGTYSEVLPDGALADGGGSTPIEIAGSPLGLLSELFGLSPFEIQVLMLCAGMELDGSFPALCGMAQSDPAKTYPTFGLALAVLPGADWRALLPEGALRYWQFVAQSSDASLTSAPLAIDERILHYLIGFPSQDPRLAPWTQSLEAPPHLVGSEARAAERIAEIFRGSLRRSANQGHSTPVIQLVGTEIAGKRDLAATAGISLGVEVHRMSVESLPVRPAELDELVRLWRREARLSGAILLLECDELRLDDLARGAAVHQLIDRLDVPLLISATDRLPPRQRANITLELGKPTAEEQLAVWHMEIHDFWPGLRAGSAPKVPGTSDVLDVEPKMPGTLDGTLDPSLDASSDEGPKVPGTLDDIHEEGQALDLTLNRMVEQFDLSPRQIRSACADARGILGDAPGVEALRTEIWRSSRALARPRLEDLAPVKAPDAHRKDLVLPRASRRLLDEIVIHMRQRSRVHRDWGFARASGRGLGITALFAGPSGTGKTLAAEVLASELDLDLARIDLSAVVSKYIGETEKNLRRVFDAAEDGGAVLLFDEADALFGKRSEVKDSHDRHANVEVSYLLQRMEAYRGLAILTTNLKDALDQAFLRRLRFVVDFPFPSASQREEIWRRAFPEGVPLGDLRFDYLARLRLTGGNIRNIALGSAFFAAHNDSPVTMRHLLAAARREHVKIGRPLPENAVADWLSARNSQRETPGGRAR